MNNIGLTIRVAQTGDDELLTINDGEWKNKVFDARTYLTSVFSTFSKNDKFKFFTFTNDGALLSIGKCIGGRGDYAACWLFIPKNLVVPGKSIKEAIEIIDEKVISSASVDAEDLKAALSPILNNNFAEKKATTNIKALPSGKFAFRGYGKGYGYQINELLDSSNIYQDYYMDYTAIFLVEKDGLQPDKEFGLTDFTDKELAGCVSLLPPNSNSLGFRPYIDGQIFDSPLCWSVIGSKKVTVVWKKTDFEDVQIDENVKSENQKASDFPEASAKKVIRPESFNVFSDRGERVSDLIVYIDGRNIGNNISVPVSKLKGANVKIECEGYDSKTIEHYNLESMDRITLIKNMEIRQFYLDDQKYTVRIESKHHINDDVIDGYNIEGNRLVKKANKAAAYIMGTAVAGLFLGMGIGYLLFADNKTETPSLANTESVQANESTPQENQIKLANADSLIKYINKMDPYIRKTELDKYDTTLFNNLHSYNTADALKILNEVAKRDTNKNDAFNKLVDHLKAVKIKPSDCKDLDTKALISTQIDRNKYLSNLRKLSEVPVEDNAKQDSTLKEKSEKKQSEKRVYKEPKNEHKNDESVNLNNLGE